MLDGATDGTGLPGAQALGQLRSQVLQSRLLDLKKRLACVQVGAPGGLHGAVGAGILPLRPGVLGAQSGPALQQLAARGPFRSQGRQRMQLINRGPSATHALLPTGQVGRGGAAPLHSDGERRLGCDPLGPVPGSVVQGVFGPLKGFGAGLQALAQRTQSPVASWSAQGAQDRAIGVPERGQRIGEDLSVLLVLVLGGDEGTQLAACRARPFGGRHPQT